MLEQVPNDKLTWKPHKKSRTLGELAMHVANIPGMADKIVNYEEFPPSLPMQFRAEAFNVFKYTNFGLPNQVVFGGRMDVCRPRVYFHVHMYALPGGYNKQHF